MSSGETLHTHRTPSNWEGSNECASEASEFGTSHVQDSNPSPITSTTVAHAGNDEHSQIASSKVQDSNPGSLTNPTAEVISSPRGRDPLPSGYTHQSGPRQKASIVQNGPAADVITQGEGAACVDITQVGSEKGTSVNSDIVKVSPRCENSDQLIFDVNYSGIEDKFVNSILHARHAIDVNKVPNVDNDSFHKWRRQSAFNFGYVPLGDQLMPGLDVMNDTVNLTPIEMHHAVRETNKPNFIYFI